jgi:hypothetical protein
MTTSRSSTKPVTPSPIPAAPAPGPSAVTDPPPIITSARNNKVAVEVSLQTLVTGLPLVFAGEDSLPLPSGTYTIAQIIGVAQQGITAIEATKATETQYHDAVAAERPVVEAALALQKEVKQLAVGRFGAQSSKLSQLGCTPAKPREVSAATKAASAAKAKATRAAKKAPAPPAPASPPPAPKPGT